MAPASLASRLRSAAPRRLPLVLLRPPADEEFWRKMPEILQAQVMVAIETAARKNARLNLPPEQILWAGTPYLRTRTVVLLFLLWSILLVLPVVFLVELVDDIGDTGIDGGWLSLAWAVVSVFIFVPRVTRPSREVFVLTNRRAFLSRRTMWCSIETEQLNLDEVTSAKLDVAKGGSTGTLTLVAERTPQPPYYIYEPDIVVRFSQVLDLRDMCRVLDNVLPPEVMQRAGIGGSRDG